MPNGDPSGTPVADPATPPAPVPGAPANPAPQLTPPAGLDPHAPIDFEALAVTHPNVTALIAQLRNENGGHRQVKSAAEKAAAEAIAQRDAAWKALGYDPADQDITPETVAQRNSEHLTALNDALWGERVKGLVWQHADRLGVDATALIGNEKFQDTLDDLIDDDPTAPEFLTALEAKITNAVAADTTLRAKPRGPARQGIDITGSGGGPVPKSNSLEAALARKLGG